MQISGVAIGPLDLTGGTELLVSSNKQGFPWLSANLLDQKGRPLVSPSRTICVGKIKATLIGLTGPIAELPKNVSRAEWHQVLPKLLKKQSGKQDIIILLSTLLPAENEAIARQFPEIQVIVTGDESSGNKNPQQINNSLLTQTDHQGKYLGMLSIDWGKSGKWGTDNREELNTLRNRISALDWQLKRMRQNKDSQQAEFAEKIKMVEENRAGVEQQLKTLQQQATDQARDKFAPATFIHQFIALSHTLPEAASIKDIISNIKRQIDTLHQRRSNNQVSLPFLGQDGCKECHPRQFDFWNKTRHAQAYLTLVERNQAHNAECLPCHVVGAPHLALNREQLLGMPSILQAVTCENCHQGSGKEHAAQPQAISMTRPIEEKTCRGCHSPEHNPAFDYPKKISQVTCPTG